MERAVKLLKGLMLLAIIGAVFFLVCRYADRNEKEVLPEGITAVNGRLEVKRIDLASLYAGRIDELLADRGDHVARNQVIARISSAQTEAQLKAAKAQHERAVETEKTMITSPRLHALRSVVSIPNSGKATTLLYVVNANMLFSIIPPPQSP